jgi:biopolymer transport protein TolR
MVRAAPWIGKPIFRSRPLRNFSFAASVNSCVAMQMGSANTFAAINVTPMIDVMLVLLITFLLLPTHTKGLPSEVAPDAPEATAAPRDSLDIVLRIGKDRSIEIDSRPTPQVQLEERLKTLSVTRPHSVLFIRGAQELEYADVATVIDIARGAGWNRVGLLTGSSGP